MVGQSQWRSQSAILMLINPIDFDTPCKVVLSPEDEAAVYFTTPHPPTGHFLRPTTQHLALWTSKKWPDNGVRLRVGFIDKPLPDHALRKKIVNSMNAWSEFCDVRFTLVDDPIGAEVRISFSGKVLGEPHPGYWSNVGTDILGVDHRKPTMMLTGAPTMGNSDWFFTHVVRHETGHTLGFMHEHLRPELVRRIDPAKAIKYYGGKPNKWCEWRTKSNVLHPLEMSEYTATAHADIHSIMCYSVSNNILKKGASPITGGYDFSNYDRKHAASIYPDPEVDWTYVSLDQRTTAITASGLSFYKLLSDGQIQTYWEVEGNVPPGVASLFAALRLAFIDMIVYRQHGKYRTI